MSSIADKIKQKLEEIENYSNNEEASSSNKWEYKLSENLTENDNDNYIENANDYNNDDDISSINTKIKEIQNPYPYEAIGNNENEKEEEYENIDNFKIGEEYRKYDNTIGNNYENKTPLKNSNKKINKFSNSKSSYSTQDTNIKNFNYMELGNSIDEKDSETDNDNEEENDKFYYRESFYNSDNVKLNKIVEKKFDYKKSNSLKYENKFNSSRMPSMRKSNLKHQKFSSLGIAERFFTNKENNFNENFDCEKNINIDNNEKENDLYKNKPRVKFSNYLCNESNNNKTSESEKEVAEKFYDCIGKSFVLLFLFILLAFDPFVVICLKIVDLIVLKFCSNKINNTNTESQESYSNLTNENSNLDETENNSLESIDSQEPSVGFYEKYNNYFFVNKYFKEYRKVMKSVFIGISLMLNILILTSNLEKTSFTLIFFLNNLYLLFHTMDLYNQNLMRYTEKIKWNSLLHLERN